MYLSVNIFKAVLVVLFLFFKIYNIITKCISWPCRWTELELQTKEINGNQHIEINSKYKPFSVIIFVSFLAFIQLFNPLINSQ